MRRGSYHLCRRLGYKGFVLTRENPLILGSASPRRRELLDAVRVPYKVLPASADEAVRPGEAPDDYMDRVVTSKLALVACALATQGAAGRAILVADTSVILGMAILGKPADAREALAMITALSGRTHEVWTRFMLAETSGEPLHAETVRTQVTFRTVTDAECQAYAAFGEGMDKAGGYAVQGLAGAFVSHLSGSYANVVGLPVCEVVSQLTRLGLFSIGA